MGIYATLSADMPNIAIMRVENGWLVRVDNRFGDPGNITPLRVAETPEALLSIIGDWAQSQHKSGAPRTFD